MREAPHQMGGHAGVGGWGDGQASFQHGRATEPALELLRHPPLKSEDPAEADGAQKKKKTMAAASCSKNTNPPPFKLCAVGATVT